jgi:hypothetical protein
LVGFAFLGLVLPVFGQGDKPVDLKWKFEKNKPFYQTMETKTQQTMKVMGSDVVQNQNQTFYFKITPIEQQKDNWVLEEEIVGVKMSIDIGGTKVDYDSTKEGAAANPLGDFFKALLGSKFRITLDKDNKVIKVEGRDDFLNKLTKANPQMDKLLKEILSEEALKEMAEPMFAAVPTTAVKKGGTWDRKSTLKMGPIGSYENTYKYTFEGQQPDTKLEKIKVETTVKYLPPSESATNEGGLPFKIKAADSDLKSTGSTGEILFDNTKGRVESSKMTLDLSGQLSIDISGQTTKVELKQHQETTVKTSDNDPAKPVTPPKKQ